MNAMPGITDTRHHAKSVVFCFTWSPNSSQHRHYKTAIPITRFAAPLLKNSDAINSN
jgi:hypothetical protein